MKKTRNKGFFSVAVALMGAFAAQADSLEMQIRPGEGWWGACNNFGRDMPFTEKSAFACDLRLHNYSHQSLSFLCSDKGRVLWCDEPVSIKIKDGKIALASDKGKIVLNEDAGRTLAETFRYGVKTWFPPTGEEPELLYFAAPQYNTWIELTYHQNERDILAYAKAMIDQGADVFFGDASAVDSGARQAIDEHNKAAGEINVYDIAQPGDFLGQNECIIGSQVTDNSSLVGLSMKATMDGTFGGEVIYGTLENGVLSAGKLNDLIPEDIQTKYLAYVDEMKAGTFMK